MTMLTEDMNDIHKELDNHVWHVTRLYPIYVCETKCRKFPDTTPAAYATLSASPCWNYRTLIGRRCYQINNFFPENFLNKTQQLRRDVEFN